MIYDALRVAKSLMDKSAVLLYDDYVYTILETTTKNVDGMVVSYSDKIFRTYVYENAAIDMCEIYNNGLDGKGIIIDEHDGTITTKTYSYIKNEIFRDPITKEYLCH